MLRSTMKELLCVLGASHILGGNMWVGVEGAHMTAQAIPMKS